MIDLRQLYIEYSAAIGEAPSDIRYACSYTPSDDHDDEPDNTTSHKDGTRSYEYDSRYYSIEIDKL